MSNYCFLSGSPFATKTQIKLKRENVDFYEALKNKEVVFEYIPDKEKRLKGDSLEVRLPEEKKSRILQAMNSVTVDVSKIYSDNLAYFFHLAHDNNYIDVNALIVDKSSDKQNIWLSSAVGLSSIEESNQIPLLPPSEQDKDAKEDMIFVTNINTVKVFKGSELYRLLFGNENNTITKVIERFNKHADEPIATQSKEYLALIDNHKEHAIKSLKVLTYKLWASYYSNLLLELLGDTAEHHEIRNTIKQLQQELEPLIKEYFKNVESANYDMVNQLLVRIHHVTNKLLNQSFDLGNAKKQLNTFYVNMLKALHPEQGFLHALLYEELGKYGDSPFAAKLRRFMGSRNTEGSLLSLWFKEEAIKDMEEQEENEGAEVDEEEESNFAKEQNTKDMDDLLSKNLSFYDRMVLELMLNGRKSNIAQISNYVFHFLSYFIGVKDIKENRKNVRAIVKDISYVLSKYHIQTAPLRKHGEIGRITQLYNYFTSSSSQGNSSFLNSLFDKVSVVSPNRDVANISSVYGVSVYTNQYNLFGRTGHVVNYNYILKTLTDIRDGNYYLLDENASSLLWRLIATTEPILTENVVQQYDNKMPYVYEFIDTLYEFIELMYERNNTDLYLTKDELFVLIDTNKANLVTLASAVKNLFVTTAHNGLHVVNSSTIIHPKNEFSFLFVHKYKGDAYYKHLARAYIRILIGEYTPYLQNYILSYHGKSPSEKSGEKKEITIRSAISYLVARKLSDKLMAEKGLLTETQREYLKTFVKEYENVQDLQTLNFELPQEVKNFVIGTFPSLLGRWYNDRLYNNSSLNSFEWLDSFIEPLVSYLSETEKEIAAAQDHKARYELSNRLIEEDKKTLLVYGINRIIPQLITRRFSDDQGRLNKMWKSLNYMVSIDMRLTHLLLNVDASSVGEQAKKAVASFFAKIQDSKTDITNLTAYRELFKELSGFVLYTIDSSLDRSSDSQDTMIEFARKYLPMVWALNAHTLFPKEQKPEKSGELKDSSALMSNVKALREVSLRQLNNYASPVYVGKGGNYKGDLNRRYSHLENKYKFVAALSQFNAVLSSTFKTASSILGGLAVVVPASASDVVLKNMDGENKTQLFYLLSAVEEPDAAIIKESSDEGQESNLDIESWNLSWEELLKQNLSGSIGSSVLRSLDGVKNPERSIATLFSYLLGYTNNPYGSKEKSLKVATVGNHNSQLNTENDFYELINPKGKLATLYATNIEEYHKAMMHHLNGKPLGYVMLALLVHRSRLKRTYWSGQLLSIKELFKLDSSSSDEGKHDYDYYFGQLVYDPSPLGDGVVSHGMVHVLKANKEGVLQNTPGKEYSNPNYASVYGGFTDKNKMSSETSINFGMSTTASKSSEEEGSSNEVVSPDTGVVYNGKYSLVGEEVRPEMLVSFSSLVSGEYYMQQDLKHTLQIMLLKAINERLKDKGLRLEIDTWSDGKGGIHQRFEWLYLKTWLDSIISRMEEGEDKNNFIAYKDAVIKSMEDALARQIKAFLENELHAIKNLSDACAVLAQADKLYENILEAFRKSFNLGKFGFHVDKEKNIIDYHKDELLDTILPEYTAYKGRIYKEDSIDRINKFEEDKVKALKEITYFYSFLSEIVSNIVSVDSLLAAFGHDEANNDKVRYQVYMEKVPTLPLANAGFIETLSDSLYDGPHDDFSYFLSRGREGATFPKFSVYGRRPMRSNPLFMVLAMALDGSIMNEEDTKTVIAKYNELLEVSNEFLTKSNEKLEYNKHGDSYLLNGGLKLKPFKEVLKYTGKITNTNIKNNNTVNFFCRALSKWHKKYVEKNTEVRERINDISRVLDELYVKYAHNKRWHAEVVVKNMSGKPLTLTRDNKNFWFFSHGLVDAINRAAYPNKAYNTNFNILTTSLSSILSHGFGGVNVPFKVTRGGNEEFHYVGKTTSSTWFNIKTYLQGQATPIDTEQWSNLQSYHHYIPTITRFKYTKSLRRLQYMIFRNDGNYKLTNPSYAYKEFSMAAGDKIKLGSDIELPMNNIGEMGYYRSFSPLFLHDFIFHLQSLVERKVLTNRYDTIQEVDTHVLSQLQALLELKEEDPLLSLIREFVEGKGPLLERAPFSIKEGELVSKQETSSEKEEATISNPLLNSLSAWLRASKDKRAPLSELLQDLYDKSNRWRQELVLLNNEEKMRMAYDETLLFMSIFGSMFRYVDDSINEKIEALDKKEDKKHLFTDLHYISSWRTQDKVKVSILDPISRYTSGIYNEYARPKDTSSRWQEGEYEEMSPPDDAFLSEEGQAEQQSGSSSGVKRRANAEERYIYSVGGSAPLTMQLDSRPVPRNVHEPYVIMEGIAFYRGMQILFPFMMSNVMLSSIIGDSVNTPMSVKKVENITKRSYSTHISAGVPIVAHRHEIGNMLYELSNPVIRANIDAYSNGISYFVNYKASDSINIGANFYEAGSLSHYFNQYADYLPHNANGYMPMDIGIYHLLNSGIIGREDPRYNYLVQLYTVLQKAVVKERHNNEDIYRFVDVDSPEFEKLHKEYQNIYIKAVASNVNILTTFKLLYDGHTDYYVGTASTDSQENMLKDRFAKNATNMRLGSEIKSTNVIFHPFMFTEKEAQREIAKLYSFMLQEKVLFMSDSEASKKTQMNVVDDSGKAANDGLIQVRVDKEKREIVSTVDLNRSTVVFNRIQADFLKLNAYPAQTVKDKVKINNKVGVFVKGASYTNKVLLEEIEKGNLQLLRAVGQDIGKGEAEVEKIVVDTLNNTKTNALNHQALINETSALMVNRVLYPSKQRKMIIENFYNTPFAKLVSDETKQDIIALLNEGVSMYKKGVQNVRAQITDERKMHGTQQKYINHVVGQKTPINKNMLVKAFSSSLTLLNKVQFEYMNDSPLVVKLSSLLSALPSGIKQQLSSNESNNADINIEKLKGSLLLIRDLSNTLLLIENAEFYDPSKHFVAKGNAFQDINYYDKETLDKANSLLADENDRLVVLSGKALNKMSTTLNPYKFKNITNKNMLLSIGFKHSTYIRWLEGGKANTTEERNRLNKLFENLKAKYGNSMLLSSLNVYASELGDHLLFSLDSSHFTKDIDLLATASIITTAITVHKKDINKKLEDIIKEMANKMSKPIILQEQEESQKQEESLNNFDFVGALKSDDESIDKAKALYYINLLIEHIAKELKGKNRGEYERLLNEFLMSYFHVSMEELARKEKYQFVTIDVANVFEHGYSGLVGVLAGLLLGRISLKNSSLGEISVNTEKVFSEKAGTEMLEYNPLPAVISFNKSIVALLFHREVKGDFRKLNEWLSSDERIGDQRLQFMDLRVPSQKNSSLQVHRLYNVMLASSIMSSPVDQSLSGADNDEDTQHIMFPYLELHIKLPSGKERKELKKEALQKIKDIYSADPKKREKIEKALNVVYKEERTNKADNTLVLSLNMLSRLLMLLDMEDIKEFMGLIDPENTADVKINRYKSKTWLSFINAAKSLPFRIAGSLPVDIKDVPSVFKGVLASEEKDNLLRSHHIKLAVNQVATRIGIIVYAQSLMAIGTLEELSSAAEGKIRRMLSLKDKDGKPLSLPLAGIIPNEIFSHFINSTVDVLKETSGMYFRSLMDGTYIVAFSIHQSSWQHRWISTKGMWDNPLLPQTTYDGVTLNDKENTYTESLKALKYYLYMLKPILSDMNNIADYSNIERAKGRYADVKMLAAIQSSKYMREYIKAALEYDSTWVGGASFAKNTMNFYNDITKGIFNFNHMFSILINSALHGDVNILSRIKDREKKTPTALYANNTVVESEDLFSFLDILTKLLQYADFTKLSIHEEEKVITYNEIPLTDTAAMSDMIEEALNNYLAEIGEKDSFDVQGLVKLYSNIIGSTRFSHGDKKVTITVNGHLLISSVLMKAKKADDLLAAKEEGGRDLRGSLIQLSRSLQLFVYSSLSQSLKSIIFPSYQESNLKYANIIKNLPAIDTAAKLVEVLLNYNNIIKSGDVKTALYSLGPYANLIKASVYLFMSPQRMIYNFKLFSNKIGDTSLRQSFMMLWYLSHHKARFGSYLYELKDIRKVKDSRMEVTYSFISLSKIILPNLSLRHVLNNMMIDGREGPLFNIQPDKEYLKNNELGLIAKIPTLYVSNSISQDNLINYLPEVESVEDNIIRYKLAASTSLRDKTLSFSGLVAGAYSDISYTMEAGIDQLLHFMSSDIEQYIESHERYKNHSDIKKIKTLLFSMLESIKVAESDINIHMIDSLFGSNEQINTEYLDIAHLLWKGYLGELKRRIQNRNAQTLKVRLENTMNSKETEYDSMSASDAIDFLLSYLAYKLQLLSYSVDTSHVSLLFFVDYIKKMSDVAFSTSNQAVFLYAEETSNIGYAGSAGRDITVEMQTSLARSLENAYKNLNNLIKEETERNKNQAAKGNKNQATIEKYTEWKNMYESTEIAALIENNASNLPNFIMKSLELYEGKDGGSLLDLIETTNNESLSERTSLQLEEQLEEKESGEPDRGGSNTETKEINEC